MSLSPIQMQLNTLGKAAKEAARHSAKAQSAQKNNVLRIVAQALLDNEAAIITANSKDIKAAQKQQRDEAFIDRLALKSSTIKSMAEGLRQIADLPDLVGNMSDIKTRPSGIQLGKMRVPIGVIGIIYESRPNVTIDAAGLCLKSGNACILRGGSEAWHSNTLLATLFQQGLEQGGLPATIVQTLPTPEREAVRALIQASEFVDVIIPRGGKNLVREISEHAKVPVIKHLDGICHVYVDEFADAEMAVRIADNAKTHRYGVCNAMETLLVHPSRINDVLIPLAKIYKAKGVELRGCARTVQHIEYAIAATEEDWSTEYLAPVLSIRLVETLDEAITHINTYSSHHTDSIITERYAHSWKFLNEVDSASVMVNASTRFADGFEYGLGAEIGISTDRLHARGPVGLEGLTTEKWIVFGHGEIRE